MKVWGSLVGGVVLVLLGVLWTLQGLDLLGGSGGMNGQKAWAVIGPTVGVVGLILIAVGARSRRRAQP
jgi:hypothetical protein